MALTANAWLPQRATGARSPELEQSIRALIVFADAYKPGQPEVDAVVARLREVVTELTAVDRQLRRKNQAGFIADELEKELRAINKGERSRAAAEKRIARFWRQATNETL